MFLADESFRIFRDFSRASEKKKEKKEKKLILVFVHSLECFVKLENTKKYQENCFQSATGSFGRKLCASVIA